MATYNGEKYLREQIDSILCQTNRDWTLYIQDDGSKDATLDIIKSYDDERIVLVGMIEEVIISKGGEVSCTAVFQEYDCNGCIHHTWEQTFVSDDFDVWLFHDISMAQEKLTRVADETVMLPWWLL